MAKKWIKGDAKDKLPVTEAAKRESASNGDKKNKAPTPKEMRRSMYGKE